MSYQDFELPIRLASNRTSNLERRTSKYSVREFPQILIPYFLPMPPVGNVTDKSRTLIVLDSIFTSVVSNTPYPLLQKLEF
jgi:hypothetical protein